MSLKRDISSHKTMRPAPPGMYRGFVVLLLSFLFISQALQSGAREADGQQALKFESCAVTTTQYARINRPVKTDASVATNPAMCGHCALSLFAGRQHIEPLPAYFAEYQSIRLSGTMHLLPSIPATGYLRRTWLNNRGPPQGNLLNIIFKDASHAQNATSLIAEEMQWR